MLANGGWDLIQRLKGQNTSLLWPLTRIHNNMSLKRINKLRVFEQTARKIKWTYYRWSNKKGSKRCKIQRFVICTLHAWQDMNIHWADMTESFTNNELEGAWKEPKVASFRYYPDTRLEAAKTTTQTAAVPVYGTRSEPRASQIRSMGKFGAGNSHPVSHYRNKKTTTWNQILLTKTAFRFIKLSVYHALTFHKIGTQLEGSGRSTRRFHVWYTESQMPLIQVYTFPFLLHNEHYKLHAWNKNETGNACEQIRKEPRHVTHTHTSGQKMLNPTAVIKVGLAG